MAILPVYLYDQPILKHTADPVEEITQEISDFIDAMVETMKNAHGIGLAANQVGSPWAITVINLAGMEDANAEGDLHYINPVIEHFSDEQSDFEEGCLSLPNYRDKVVRPDAIQLRYFDRDLKEHTQEVDGLLARVLQHEIDHLNGVYFFERLTPVRRAMAHNKLKRIKRGGIETDYPVELHKRNRTPSKRR
jgi:peptide deformylase